jgi:hypothetical protein
MTELKEQLEKNRIKIIEENEKNLKLTTMAISKKNLTILQRMGFAGQSYNDVLDVILEKILSKQPGVYRIETAE